MAFNKEEYWKNKENNVGSKRPKPEYKFTGDAEKSFGPGGTIIIKNREYRRSEENKGMPNIFKKKGFIPHLNAVKIKRSKNGKVKTKIFHLPV